MSVQSARTLTTDIISRCLTVLIWTSFKSHDFLSFPSTIILYKKLKKKNLICHMKKRPQTWEFDIILFCLGCYQLPVCQCRKNPLFSSYEISSEGPFANSILWLAGISANVPSKVPRIYSISYFPVTWYFQFFIHRRSTALLCSVPLFTAFLTYF